MDSKQRFMHRNVYKSMSVKATLVLTIEVGEGTGVYYTIHFCVCLKCCETKELIENIKVQQ